MRACMQVVAFLKDNGHRPSDVPLVLGGDFNSLWRKYRSDDFDQARSAVKLQDSAPGEQHAVGSAEVHLLQVLPGQPLTSGVYQLLASGQLSPAHPDHAAMRRSSWEVGPLHSSGLSLQSAYLTNAGM